MYDGIILGAGHHGLILQAYLGRAGLRTLALDARDTAGGGLTTVEYPIGTGFLHNTHAFYHRGLTAMPWYRDLDLERLGAQYIQPDCNVALVGPRGEVLQWWSDFEKTVESFARVSPPDAERLRVWRDDFREIVQRILIPESQSPPLPPARRQQLLQRSTLGRRLLDTSRLSPLEFVTREFEHPLVQAGLLFFNGLREVDLRLPGFGHHIPALLASDAMAQMCRGGSARLAEALVRSVQSHGGQFAGGARIERILVEQGRAVGVETNDGEIIRSRHFVASSLNPQQTFLELLDAEHVSDVWRQRAAGFQYNLLAPLFGLHVNLSEPPRYSAADEAADLDRALMVIVGLESPAQFHDIVRCHELGTVPPPVMWGSCPTQFDASQAPEGHHTAFMWEKLPYALRGDARGWDDYRDEHARRMVDAWARFAPNLRESILDSFAQSPLDVERNLPNMRYGDLLVGAFAHDQIGYYRPFPGAGEYRTHLPGLYLCGSSCHPGGNITGLAGYNAARVLLADLGIAADWFASSVEEQFERLP